MSYSTGKGSIVAESDVPSLLAQGVEVFYYNPFLGFWVEVGKDWAFGPEKHEKEQWEIEDEKRRARGKEIYDSLSFEDKLALESWFEDEQINTHNGQY